MQCITVEAAAARPAPHDENAQSALAGIIASIGDASFGRQVLVQLNRWMPLCWLSVYQLFDDALPVMHASASYGVPDGTRDSFRVYRAGLYRGDETFSESREQIRGGHTVVVHWNAREMRPKHREAIYSRHGLRERLSVVSGGDHRSLLAVNLYRHEEQPAFSEEAIEAVGRLGQPLVACVNRHLNLRAGPSASTRSDLFDPLTDRERDVCKRLLKGWTYEGIAADLCLSPGTVKTYRDRAFERLGIHHRNELFALVRSVERSS